MYYIYHIPGIKIGCADNVERRVIKRQGYTNFEILETHEDIYVASNREIELQKEYGLPVDTIPYWKTIQMSSKGGLVGGSTNKESGHWDNIRSLGGNKKGCKVDWLRKLTDQQEDEIVAKYIPRKYTMDRLAKEYGVARTTIQYILNKRKG